MDASVEVAAEAVAGTSDSGRPPASRACGARLRATVKLKYTFRSTCAPNRYQLLQEAKDILPDNSWWTGRRWNVKVRILKS